MTSRILRRNAFYADADWENGTIPDSYLKYRVCSKGLARYFHIPKNTKAIRIHATKRAYNGYSIRADSGETHATLLYINDIPTAVYIATKEFVHRANASGRYYFWVEIVE